MKERGRRFSIGTYTWFASTPPSWQDHNHAHSLNPFSTCPYTAYSRSASRRWGWSGLTTQHSVLRKAIIRHRVIHRLGLLLLCLLLVQTAVVVSPLPRKMPTFIGTAAPRLWQTAETAADFQEATTIYYDASIAGMSKKDLPALDTFWRKTLPGLLRERQAKDKDKACWLTKDELVQVMQWKLARGKMRPLMNLVRGNDAATVQRITKAGLAAANTGDVSGAITTLSGPELKGIGPATASAVLAAYRPELFPFMADEPTLIVLGGGGGGKLKYNLAEYLQFQKAVVKKCKEINNAGKGKKGEAVAGGPLTAEEIGRALWCVSKAEALGKWVEGGRVGGKEKEGDICEMREFVLEI